MTEDEQARLAAEVEAAIVDRYFECARCGRTHTFRLPGLRAYYAIAHELNCHAAQEARDD